MTDNVERRACLLIDLARKLRDANPDFALADVVQIVSAADVADKLNSINDALRDQQHR